MLKEAGPESVRFAAMAIPFLNQVLRPLTAKWHPRLIAGDLDTPSGKTEFRDDLKLIRKLIHGYLGLVGEVAGVEESDQLG